LAIRPEHVKFAQNGQADENLVPAEVREIVFAGATSTVRVNANGLLLEALVLEPNGLKVGDHCAVVLSPERLSLLKTQ
jgi:hypothetical protein